MLPRPKHTAAGFLGLTLALIPLTAGNSLAGTNHRKPVMVVYPRYLVRVPVSPYAPYYYSRWNPYSLYSIYDHLSGGRQLCRLPLPRWVLNPVRDLDCCINELRQLQTWMSKQCFNLPRRLLSSQVRRQSHRFGTSACKAALQQ